MFRETHSKILSKYQNKDQLVQQLIEHPLVQQLPQKVVKTQKLQDALVKSQQSSQSNSIIEETNNCGDGGDHEFSRDIESAIDQAIEVENLIEQVKTSLERINELVSQISIKQQAERVEGFKAEMVRVQELKIYAGEMNRSITFVREEYDRSQLLTMENVTDCTSKVRNDLISLA